MSLSICVWVNKEFVFQGARWEKTTFFMAGVCKINQGGNWHSKLVPLNSNSVCYSGLHVFPWYMVRCCLALGRKKRRAGQWFLVVLSVTVQVEGKSKVQGGQEMGHSDRRKGEVTVGNSLGFRKRARACRSHAILSVVSCQRFMWAWSEEGEWLGGQGKTAGRSWGCS